MQLFDKDKKLVVIYLSKTACLDYTKEMIRGFKKLDPLLVVSQKNEVTFTDYDPLVFLGNTSILSDFIFSLSINSRVRKLLDSLQKEHGPLQLYFPAFHPLNHVFLKWVSQNKGCSSYLTIHDAVTHKGESSRMIERLQHKGIKLATKVICLTKYVKSQLVGKLGEEEKYLVLPHPILPSGITNNLEHSRRPKLLFLGRVVKYKGVENLLSAIQGLDIGNLTIAGKQHQKIKTDSPKVTVIDRVLKADEITQLLEGHHILILPYLEASQSGVVALGIDAEMVMVISKVGGLPEQLPEGAALWVLPEIESLRAGLKELMENEVVYQDIKLAVRNFKKDGIS